MSESAAELFVTAARQALGEGRPITIPAMTVLEIAGDATEILRFRRLMREANDPELRELMAAYLVNLQRSQARHARSAELWADNIKLGVGGVGAGTVVTGIVSIVAASATGGLVLIASGIIGIAFAIGGHTFFRTSANAKKDAVDDVAILMDALKDTRS